MGMIVLAFFKQPKELNVEVPGKGKITLNLNSIINNLNKIFFNRIKYSNS